MAGAAGWITSSSSGCGDRSAFGGKTPDKVYATRANEEKLAA
jgi:hypothetical protein